MRPLSTCLILVASLGATATAALADFTYVPKTKDKPHPTLLEEGHDACVLRLFGKVYSPTVQGDGGFGILFFKRKRDSQLPTAMFGPSVTLQGGLRYRIWSTKCTVIDDENLKYELPYKGNKAIYFNAAIGQALIGGFSAKDQDVKVSVAPFSLVLSLQYELTSSDSPEQTSPSNPLYVGLSAIIPFARTNVTAGKDGGETITEKARALGFAIQFGIKL